MQTSHWLRRSRYALAGVALLGLNTVTAVDFSLTPAFAKADRQQKQDQKQHENEDQTPLRYLIVIFQENVSFDHYFATYPQAANPAGEPSFQARLHTPLVDNLVTANLLTSNPNAAQPFRLDRAQANTCDQNHEYKAEQEAFDQGRMDKFVETTGVGSTTCHDYGHSPGLVMGYFDGNTVTALWNYAQYFAMSDNSFNTTFGPSTPGALNLIAGQTHGAFPENLSTAFGPDTTAGSVIGDPQPEYDDCTTREFVHLTGRNVGDLLNAKGITWGWFQGGFAPTTAATSTTKAKCASAHIGSNGKSKGDYIPHHEPFQYYASTANPHHLPPSTVSMIGQTDQANHQYDLTDFWAAVNAGTLPAVSFLKASGYQDGHADYSDPLAEQTFLVETLNRLQALPQWRQMAVIIAYDDSDGWYDHVAAPLVSSSMTSEDALTGAGSCGSPKPGAYQGRCGYGPRLPLLVISPFAKENFVAHNVTDQSSILRLIEDNWKLGRIGDQSFDQKAGSLMNMFTFGDDGGEGNDKGEGDRGHPSVRQLILDPTTGQIVKN